MHASLTSRLHCAYRCPTALHAPVPHLSTELELACISKAAYLSSRLNLCIFMALAAAPFQPAAWQCLPIPPRRCNPNHRVHRVSLIPHPPGADTSWPALLPVCKKTNTDIVSRDALARGVIPAHLEKTVNTHMCPQPARPLTAHTPQGPSSAAHKPAPVEPCQQGQPNPSCSYTRNGTGLYGPDTLWCACDAIRPTPA